MSIHHGLSNTPEYETWKGIKKRCYNSKCKQFKDYGGRGIKVCERWFKSFENFYKDMGQRPSKEYSIDRIDVNGDYCPENCKWSTREEQVNNARSNHLLTYNGKTQNISRWSKELGIKRETIADRLLRGWSIEKTLSTPVTCSYH